MLVIIPARIGSKGILDKNIKLLGGIPLVAYSIIVAKMIPSVTRIIVSTDSQKYADIANNYGAETPFLRPSEISGDHSTDYELFKYTLKWLEENENYTTEYVIHLRPTTPLRDPNIMSEAIDFFLRNKDIATSIRSGHLAPESPFKWFLKDDNNYFKGIQKDITPEKVNLPRQFFPNVYIPDGYIDIFKSKNISNTDTLHGNKMLVFESPFCTEIDTNDDFNFLAYTLEKDGSVILNHFLNK